MIIQADARHLPIASGTVQCCVTSPPYWGLRDYGTAVWEGGDLDCEHRMKNPVTDQRTSTLGPNGSGLALGNTAYQHGKVFRDTCGRCGASRQDSQLGLEASPEEYVERMVSVFREVRRVLKDDGTLWLNMGDCYATGAGKVGEHPGGGERGEKWKGFRGDHPSDPKRNQSSIPMGPMTQPNRMPIAGLKPKDLVGIPWRLAFALQSDGWWLRSEIIWCLSGGTKVYARTQRGEGPATIKDIARLDPTTVKLWNGAKWTQLLGASVSPRKGDEIELTLRSGERISCTPTHKWPTLRGLIETKDLTIGDVLETCTLPEPERPARPQKIQDDVGRFIGLYLAEGSHDTGGTIQISGHLDEAESRMAWVASLAQAYGGTCRIFYGDGKSATLCVDCKILSVLIDMYLSGRTSHDKRLSPAAWRRTNTFLEDLLAGYLEGDGHYDRSNDRWRIGFTRNYCLEADLRTLCARLDLTLTLNLSTSTCREEVFASHRGEIRFVRSGHYNQRERAEIVFIGKARAREFYDIGVEDEPHVFALASGVLTHNSKPNPMPESVKDRPTKSHEQIFLLAKSERYFYDAEAIKEPSITKLDTHMCDPKSLNGSKFHDGKNAQVHPNVGKNRRKVAELGSGIKNNSDAAMAVMPDTRNKRSVWTIATQPYSGAHFATFPEKLVETCLLAGSRPGDIVFDPFVGSGTVIRVAKRLQRRGVGCDLNFEYLSKQATKRVSKVQVEIQYAPPDAGDAVPVEGR